MSDSTVSVQKSTESLIADLGNPNWKIRRQARQDLVNLGDAGSAALVATLKHHDPALRWQAAKTLSMLKDPATAPSLIQVLLDEDDTGIRWLVTDALASIGWSGLPVLFENLIQHSDSIWLYDGARHILHVLHDKGLETEATRKILSALRGIEPEITVPKLAMEAINELENKPPVHSSDDDEI